MPKLFLCIGAAMLTAAAGIASPKSCAPGNLAEYIALGPAGCSVGPLLFSNFEYTATAVAQEPLPADRISVTPDSSPLSPGVAFTPPITGSGLTFGINQVLLPERTTSGFTLPALMMKIGYAVRSETEAIDRGAIRAVLSADELATATALQTIAGTACALYVTPLQNPVQSCSFPRAAALQVANTLDLRTGAATGAGSAIRTLDVRYSTPAPVPEPQSWLLLGSGTVALAVLARAKRNKSR